MPSGALQRCYSSIVHTEYLQGPVLRTGAAHALSRIMKNLRFGGPSLWRAFVMADRYPPNFVHNRDVLQLPVSEDDHRPGRVSVTLVDIGCTMSDI